MTLVQLPSPAKINLFLHILRRREDGYHDLSMLMEKVSLFDELSFEKTPKDIQVIGGPAEIPLEENLVFTAATKLRETAGVSAGVRIRLRKKIPMGGGLGGGSSNAATVLKGLNQLWGLEWSTERLAKIGVQLGADVPFFLYDGPAKVEGIGDYIKPLNPLPNLSIIIINPGIGIATPWAYAAWDSRGKNPLTQENPSVSLPRDLEGIIEVLHNDFEDVIFQKYPEIRQVKETLLQVGALGALMSGSGSSVFGIFASKKERDEVLGKIERKPGWQVFAVENVGAGGFEPPDAGIKIL